MTITLSETLILNQVDKIILSRSNNYTIKRKKTLAAHAGIARSAQPSIRELLYERETRSCRGTTSNFFFLDSQLGLVLMQSTLTIKNSQMDLQRAFP